MFKDNSGFDIPASPGHSLKMMNDHMKTDVLRLIHEHLISLREQKVDDSPLEQLAKNLKLVLSNVDNLTFCNSINRNPFNIEPSYNFDEKKDFQHDLKLMKHHLKCHLKTIKELEMFY